MTIPYFHSAFTRFDFPKLALSTVTEAKGLSNRAFRTTHHTLRAQSYHRRARRSPSSSYPPSAAPRSIFNGAETRCTKAFRVLKSCAVTP